MGTSTNLGKDTIGQDLNQAQDQEEREGKPLKLK